MVLVAAGLLPSPRQRWGSVRPPFRHWGHRCRCLRTVAFLLPAVLFHVRAEQTVLTPLLLHFPFSGLRDLLERELTGLTGLQAFPLAKINGPRGRIQVTCEHFAVLVSSGIWR